MAGGTCDHCSQIGAGGVWDFMACGTYDHNCQKGTWGAWDSMI